MLWALAIVSMGGVSVYSTSPLPPPPRTYTVSGGVASRSGQKSNQTVVLAARNPYSGRVEMMPFDRVVVAVLTDADGLFRIHVETRDGRGALDTVYAMVVRPDTMFSSAPVVIAPGDWVTNSHTMRVDNGACSSGEIVEIVDEYVVATGGVVVDVP